ncbi:hypothetical protein [Vibrio nigripulchritudo]|uniref:hypothetical protein n=1 Tax=Vibrio nigripulchritudo TaxID=28173 RepID=UPI00249167B2|nr:hypothetical protein [Vibrio nigripulchritudo]BDU42897.1 hypothetical protein TUMSATVNIG3_16950 [Vibrio nigripulchritudo]
MKIGLIAGVETSLYVEGSWIYLEAAAGVLSFREEQSGRNFRLKQRAVYSTKGDTPLNRLLVTASETGDYELEFGFGQFTPPVEGQAVNVHAMPKMQIEDGQQVDIRQLPAVKIAPDQSLGVDSLPQVEIAPNQALSVVSLPKVEIAHNQAVGVASLPRVEFAPDQRVNIGTMPVMRIAANQSVSVTQLPALTVESLPAVSFAPDATVRIGHDVRISSKTTVYTRVRPNAGALVSGENVMPFTIPATASRKKITIKAASTNTDDVLIGFYPLSAGETLTLDTAAEIAVTGAVTDKIHFIEVAQ